MGVRRWKEGATSPSIADTLLDVAGAGLDLSLADHVRFIMGPLIGGTTVAATAVLIDGGTTGGVQYDWASGDLATAGMYRAYWEINWGAGLIEKLPQGGRFPGDPDDLIVKVTPAI